MADTIVTAVDLVKSYQIGKNVTVPVLRGINFSVSRGEFVALVGPSGSGKSTLLNLLGGMDRPTSGQLTVGGKDLVAMKDADRARYRANTVGMVFQSFNLLPHLTARQNVLMPAIIDKGVSEATKKRADDLLTQVGLTPRAGHRPTELSGGEQQRVALVRALMKNPQLILADEPTGNLDQHSGHEVIQTLIDLCRKENTTLLVVTHDPAIAAMAQRQLHLVDGQFTKAS